MAYVSQELKAKLAPAIKAICKKYKVKASIAVSNHSTLVVNIKSGPIDFVENYIQNTKDGIASRKLSQDQIDYLRKKQSLDVNTYWFQENYSGKSKAFLSELIPAMNNGNWDKSDIQTDYFNVGWYIDVNVGKWNKPYELV